MVPALPLLLLLLLLLLLRLPPLQYTSTLLIKATAPNVADAVADDDMVAVAVAVADAATAPRTAQGRVMIEEDIARLLPLSLLPFFFLLSPLFARRP